MFDVLEERRSELRKMKLARQTFASATKRVGSSLRRSRSGLASQESGTSASSQSPTSSNRSMFQRLDPRDFDLRAMCSGRRVKSDAAAASAAAPWKVKLWRMMEEPGSSTAAAAVAILILALICYSTMTFCLETLHGFYKPDLESTDFWYISEAVCISIFTVEAVLRLVSCPSKRAYLSSPMNLIDLVAILPFYLEIIVKAAAGGGDAEVPGLAVFRVVRLVRVFRLLKVSKGSINLFAETMTNSVKPLNMLLMLVSIVIVVCAALMHFIERGRFNVRMQYWERPYSHSCEVVIAAEPEGAALGADVTYSAGQGNACQRVSVADDLRSAVFRCSYPYKKNERCVTSYEQSPFSSIVGTFWWAWVTMATVGYGDHYPTTVLGKVFGMIVMFFGILVIALPITVIGSNFATAYNEEQAARESEIKAEMAAERRKAAEQAAAANALSWASSMDRRSQERDFDDISAAPASDDSPRGMPE